ncbi:putative signal transducing protein [Aureliella helgolandensis]|uniref:DUF2007 domain-containing protein n=1 Tax=Aureliella helgolandensis TaxID=2527968 RepID=A0A518G5Z7_9BACT|nr:DUF2007 domain-containing protein [Aureliella helgolandensis]QDV24012.1 hypothetical protein Q31a_23250 [Aureliella helgolandensis]|tara:strand:- start:756 stop:1112 length:357 start_codon:yes stop_codon:yes gene_type:complete
MHELVTVDECTYLGEAELIKDMLIDQGIQAVLADEHIIAMDWLLSNAIGGVKIQVQESEVPAARTIITEWRQRRVEKGEGPPIEFDCENCGKPLSFASNRRGGVETCKHCGKYVDVPE